MKKIFLFAASLMMSLGMMAADFTPTAVYTVGDEVTLGTTWASKNQSQNFFVKGDTVIFNAFLCYQSQGASKQAWTGSVGAGSTSATCEAMGSFPGSSEWGTGDAAGKVATTRSTRTYMYNVTNCAAIQILIDLKGTNRIGYIKAFEIIDGEVSSTAAATAEITENGLQVLELAGLDLTKTYQIKVNTDTDSNSNFYAIAFIGAASVKHTVSYYDGETLLGTESVKEGETPTKASNYETKAHATFAGWYNDAALTSEADFTAAIMADKAFYGMWMADAFAVSSSVNIEQLVLDHSKAYDIAAALTAANINYANIDALDSLNSSKDNNNEPFLGLKLKTAGAYVEMGLNVGDVLRVKFGNVAADVKINGTVVDKATLAAPYEYTAAAQEYVRIETTTGGTVVLKQIMINEPIAEIGTPEVLNDVTLASLTLDGVAIDGFSAATKSYTVELAEGATIPVVAATANDANATVGAISQATTLPGDATFTVTAADGTTTATYTVHFVLPREVEYLQAPYETTIPADFVMPNWLSGCTANLNYAGADTIVAGYDVIRFEKTDTVSLYVESCDSVILDLSATGSRTVAIAVDGVELANSGKFSKNTLNTLGAYVHSATPVVVNIYGVEVTGGTTISRLKVTEYGSAIITSLDAIESVKAVKVIENGRMYILRDGVKYNVQGAVVK